MNFSRNYQHDNLRFLFATLAVICSLLGTVDQWKQTSVYSLLFFFSVPCLFFLAGYYANYKRKKLLFYFLLPYIVTQSILFIIEKYVSTAFVEEEIILQFTTPLENLWYLLTIVFCYLLLPFIQIKAPKKQGAIFVGSIILSLFIGKENTVGEYMAISQTFTFLPFFIAGHYLRTNKTLQELLLGIAQKKKSKFLIFLGTCLSIFYILSPTFLSAEILLGAHSYATLEYGIKLKLLCYISSFFWITFCFYALPMTKKKLPIITNIGKQSYSVYVAQTICTCYFVATNKLTSVAAVLFCSALVLLIFGNAWISKFFLNIFSLRWLRLGIEKLPYDKVSVIFQKLHDNWMKKHHESLKIYQMLCYGISFLLIIMGIILFTVSDFLLSCFNNLSMSEIMFHLNAPMQGAGNSMFHNYFSHEKLLLSGLLFLLLAVTCFLAFYKPLRNRTRTVFICLILSICLLAGSISKIMYCLDFTEYIAAQATESPFVERFYVDPKEIKIEFPEQKRNLIYIYLESMETTFMSKEDGGAMEHNLIPELSNLAKENINFSETNGIGGACATTGSTWTIGSLTSQTTGLPLLVPFDGNSYTGYGSFLPGVTALGDILKEQGYQQEFLVGSDMAFAGRNDLFSQHGDYKLWDYYTAIEEKKIPEDYHVWWGYEDKKLYEFAKEEILELASQSQPFNFTMLTVDTHHISGFLCDICPNNSEVQYENVLSCASKQLDNFINWIKAQDFYENTTIIVTGDHLTMDEQYISSYYDNSVPRRVYNCFINALGTNEYSKNRKFSTIDMFPTTLASLGATIEGERLGLGTNLFSGKKTLAEMYGYDKMNEEFSYNSDFYIQELMKIQVDY